jgi:hypothetical protein
MDLNSERTEPVSTGNLERFAENPNKKWWDSLPAEEQNLKLKDSITKKILNVRGEPTISFRTDAPNLFAAKRAVSHDDHVSVNEGVQRVHYEPDATNQRLIESGSAEFNYNANEGKLGYQFLDIPTSVELRKVGEATLHAAGLSSDSLPLRQISDQEVLILRPRYTANQVNGFLPCNLNVIQGAQSLHMAFNAGDGKLFGNISIADVIGKTSEGNNILSPGIHFDVDKLRNKSVSQNGLTAEHNGEHIVVTREFTDGDGETKKEVIFKSPVAVDVKQGQDKLLGFGVLERPYDAFPDQDTFMETSFTGAFGIEYTPLSQKSIGNLNQLKDLFKRDDTDDDI